MQLRSLTLQSLKQTQSTKPRARVVGTGTSSRDGATPPKTMLANLTPLKDYRIVRITCNMYIL